MPVTTAPAAQVTVRWLRDPQRILIGVVQNHEDYAWSADQVGRDVGYICGIESLGVLATDDIDVLIALRPQETGLGEHQARGSASWRRRVSSAMLAHAPKFVDCRSPHWHLAAAGL